jgi:hypothetical protein
MNCIYCSIGLRNSRQPKKNTIQPTPTHKTSDLDIHPLTTDELTVHPLTTDELTVHPLTTDELTVLFKGETLECGVCKQSYTLDYGKESVLYCGGCLSFIHCGIAGTCIGPHCIYHIKDELYRQTWCVNCVPQTVAINKVEGDHCVCQLCYDDPRTPSVHKKLG